MARATRKNCNALLLPLGYELQYNRRDRYYYFAPLRDDVQQIKEQGLYGWTLSLNTPVQIRDELLRRMEAR